MIMPEEKLLDALRRCSHHDPAYCTDCPYSGWCGSNTLHMNMPKDALETITIKNSIIYDFSQTLRSLYKDLAKASVTLERYGRRIREQREEILDLLAILDGAIAGQETLQKALVREGKCVSYGDTIHEGRQVFPN